MSVATAPADIPGSSPSVAQPAVVPDAMDLGRRLQKELARVGCAVNGMETDGVWGAASRNALRAFNERIRAVGAIDQPTPEALEAVQSRKERVCPTTCESGMELRGGRCVEVHREPARHAARPSEQERPEHERPQRPQRAEPREPRRTEGGVRLPTREENQTLDPRKGESWTYLPGGKRCKTYQPMGETPRIICP
jgi:hypothetical protein